MIGYDFSHTHQKKKKKNTNNIIFLFTQLYELCFEQKNFMSYVSI